MAATLNSASYGRYKDSKRKGCPTCDGVDPKSCMRCYGHTRMCDWVFTDNGWDHRPPHELLKT